MQRRCVTIAMALASSLVPFAACAFGEDIDLAGMAVDAGLDRRRPFIDAEPLDDVPLHDEDGWLRLRFGDFCRFWAAPSPEKMPPPIAWESCEGLPAASAYACRKLKVESGGWARVNGGFVDPTGRASLGLTVDGPTRYTVIGEVDGPLHFAVRTKSQYCHLTEGSVDGVRVIYRVIHSVDSYLLLTGAIGGDLDGVPRLLEQRKPAGAPLPSYAAGPDAYFANAPYPALREWVPGGHLLTRVEIGSGSADQARFAGDTLFFRLASPGSSRIKMVGPSSNVEDVIALPTDGSRYATDFGTDGKDMVWLEGTNGYTAHDEQATLDVMAASFTTNPTTIAKRRIAAERGWVGDRSIVVGCGYAARPARSKLDGYTVHVVRLHDGHSWRLREIVQPDAGTFMWRDVHAITCDEIFLTAENRYDRPILRIRLDSLGPGEPAD